PGRAGVLLRPQLNRRNPPFRYFRQIPSHLSLQLPEKPPVITPPIATSGRVGNMGKPCRLSTPENLSAARGAAMRRCLVEKLACPECRGDIEVAEVVEENAVRILRGTLRCKACSRRYPIEKGVPRLVKVADDVAEVCRRFSFQWLSRWNGKFEG